MAAHASRPPHEQEPLQPQPQPQPDRHDNDDDEPAIPQRKFAHLVKAMVHRQRDTSWRMTDTALVALQHGAEAFLRDLLEAANHTAIHRAGLRATLDVPDIRFAQEHIMTRRDTAAAGSSCPTDDPFAPDDDRDPDEYDRHEYDPSDTNQDDQDNTSTGLHGAGEDQEEPIRGRCVICLAAASTVAFVPCFHLAACADCAQQVVAHGSICPVCRASCTSTQTVFIVSGDTGNATEATTTQRDITDKWRTKPELEPESLVQAHARHTGPFPHHDHNVARTTQTTTITKTTRAATATATATATAPA